MVEKSFIEATPAQQISGNPSPIAPCLLGLIDCRIGGLEDEELPLSLRNQ